MTRNAIPEKRRPAVESPDDDHIRGPTFGRARVGMSELVPPFDAACDHWRGGAGVVIVEYGDYECPYSRRAFRSIERLQAEDSSLRFVFRHFPLTEIHPHALAAAGFAEAAAAQGLFWPMHELLFHRQKALGEDDLFAYARQVGLDEARLRDDLERGELWQRVRDDAASALASGARGTPTLFLNGRLHAGGYNQGTLRATLDALEAT
jgi:protein-disulfide isomerase